MDTQSQKSKYYKEIKDLAASCIYSYPILHLCNKTAHPMKDTILGEYSLCWWYILNILFIKNKTQ